MKRAFLVFLILFSLFLISCNGDEYNILPFDTENIRMKCTVNGKFDIIAEKRGEGLSLSVLSPREIKGVSFYFSPERDTMTSGDMTIPVDRNELFGIYTIASVLELTENTMTTAVSRDGKGEISFYKNDILYTLHFDGEENITDIEIYGCGLDYSLKVKSIDTIK